jgi:hypothetical protein
MRCHESGLRGEIEGPEGSPEQKREAAEETFEERTGQSPQTSTQAKQIAREGPPRAKVHSLKHL